jgi:hypothetical protein
MPAHHQPRRIEVRGTKRTIHIHHPEEFGMQRTCSEVIDISWPINIVLQGKLTSHIPFDGHHYK